MKKKRKIDFVMRDFKDDRLTFRFYPKNSSVHGFDNGSPKNWNEVYKTYFAFSILKLHKEDKECGEKEYCETMYRETFDECSCIDVVAHHIRNMDSLAEDVVERCRPSGNGTCWMIKKFTRESFESISNWYEGDEKEYESYYDFFIWHDYNGKGYKFQLEESKALEFADKIDEFRQHMLENSQGI